MVAFIFYVQRFFDPIATLSQQYTVMQRAMAGAHRIFEVIDVPVLIDDAPVTRRSTRTSRRSSSATSPSAMCPGGRCCTTSFRVEPYRTVALVGATGSGKTSIAALVKRFHDRWSGRCWWRAGRHAA
jgi:ATP-binding cassette subfamily B multidrug efflux pump